MLDIAAVEEIAQRNDSDVIPVSAAVKFGDILRQDERRMIVVLDLAIVTDGEELQNVVKLARNTGALIVAKYPHVSTELYNRGKSLGIDCIVPNSKFRITLEGKL